MTRREVFLIAGVSLAARILVVMLIGIRDGVDSVKYIEAAGSWRSSGLSLPALLNESQRSPLFVAIVALFRAIFDDWRFPLVALHTLVSASLPVLLFATARRAGISWRGAWVATGIAIVSYELSRWNAYILTDALFVFFSGATLCATIVALVTRRAAWTIVVGLTLTGALLARPTGPAVALAVFMSAALVRPVAPGVLLAAFAASALSAALALSVTAEVRRGPPLTICEHLAAGSVIWGSEMFRVAPPAGLVVSVASQTLPCMARVGAKHPGHVARVLLRRAVVYWWPVYPNYSRAHRLANIVLLGIPLALALLGMSRQPTAMRTDADRLVAVCFVVSFGLFHTLTWSEGDHRFLAPVLPAICLLAGMAVQAPKRTA